MHDPGEEKVGESTLVRRKDWGRSWDGTCIVTDSLETARGLSDSTRNWGSSDCSKCNDRHTSSCPPPSVVHITHHHNR